MTPGELRAGQACEHVRLSSYTGAPCSASYHIAPPANKVQTNSHWRVRQWPMRVVCVRERGEAANAPFVETGRSHCLAYARPRRGLGSREGAHSLDASPSSLSYLISQGNDAGNAVCQGWPGVHFPEMVGRLEGETVGAARRPEPSSQKVPSSDRF